MKFGFHVAKLKIFLEQELIIMPKSMITNVSGYGFNMLK